MKKKPFVGADEDKLKEYIKLMYSKDSALNAIAVLDDRKKKACELAGLDFDKSQNILSLKDVKFKKEMFEFLNAENPHEYVMLMSNQQLFRDMQLKILEPLDEDVDEDKYLKNMTMKTALSQKSEEVYARIERLLKKIYKSDEEIEAAKGIIRMKRPEERVTKKSA